MIMKNLWKRIEKKEWLDKFLPPLNPAEAIVFMWAEQKFTECKWQYYFFFHSIKHLKCFDFVVEIKDASFFHFELFIKELK